MESKIDVSIIIINYKTFEITTNCIDSVIKYTKGLSYEIILIENGTHQFNAENVVKWQAHLNLLVAQENLGFSGANNLGLQQAKGDFILLLNSDTYLQDDAITKAYHFQQQHPEIGVLSARLVYPNGRHQSVAQRFPSLKYNIIELLRLQKLLGRKKAGKWLLGAFFDHDTTTEADWVWGAFFMFPRSVVAQLPDQQLDDTYFMYWEDVQWCWDIKKLGYQILFFAGAEVVHIHEGSKGHKSEMMEKNGALFFKRNYKPLDAYLIKLTNRWLRK